MPFYIWRVPTMLGVMACSTVVLLVAAVMAALVIRRGRALGTTIAVITILGVLVSATVAATRLTAMRISSAMDISFRYVDPGIVGYLAPPVCATFFFLVGERLLDREWTGRRALLFFLWTVGFVALNVINYCSPGWCETIGFLFPWLTWSDSILTFDEPYMRLVDAVVDIGGSLLAAALDLLLFVAVAGLLTHRRSPESDSKLPRQPA
jgi:hypothetical protein